MAGAGPGLPCDMPEFTWRPANEATTEDVLAVFEAGGARKCRCQALKVEGWIWRDSTQAASRPISAVIGAATADKVSVVNSEPQAPPVQIKPFGVHSTEKARPKCESVGVQSLPQTLTKPPLSASR